MWALTARPSDDVLSRFVGEQLYRDGTLTAVADRQLRIVARSREAARFFGHPVTNDLRAALSASPERGTRQLVALDGAAVLAAWERMPSGWTVTIGVPVGVFDAPLQRSFGGLPAFGLVVLALGVGLSLMLGRRISAAIEAVATDARSLADGDPIAERRSSIRQVRRLTRLVDDLLDVSRITQGEVALHREPVPIAQAVADAAEAVRPAIEQRRQRLVLRLPDTAPVVLADGVRFAQVFENLLSNASKYTVRGGEIAIEVEEAADAVRVSVRDTGIGLSLVRQLVELHGGTVSASSDGPGRGAYFVVALPRAHAAAATARAGRASVPRGGRANRQAAAPGA